MRVDVDGSGRVELDGAVFGFPEEVFDGAHDFPGRSLLRCRPEGNRDVLPTESVGGDGVNLSRLACYWKDEGSVESSAGLVFGKGVLNAIRFKERPVAHGCLVRC